MERGASGDMMRVEGVLKGAGCTVVMKAVRGEHAGAAVRSAPGALGRATIVWALSV